MQTTFDDIESTQAKGNEKPIWELKLDDPKAESEILQWLNNELRYLEKESEDRIREIKQNIARYKGIQYYAADTRTANRDRQQERAKYSPKLVVNYLNLITETRVSRELKYKPSIQIVPANDEFDDRNAAKNSKLVIDHIKYKNNFDALRPQIKRVAEIAGECYVDFPWDPDMGELHPDYDPEKPEPLIVNDKPVLDASGKPQMIEGEVRVGDVAANILSPLNVFLEKTDAYDKCDYAFIVEPVMTAKLKKDHPEHAGHIKAEEARTFYNLENLEDEKLINHSTKITFIHKKTKYLPKGRMITFTKDVILENVDHKYDHGEFTFERRVSENIPGERHGRSNFTNLKGMAALYNNLTNAIVKNQAMAASPKWFVPRGSVNVEALGNDQTIVQYQGAQAPVLGQQNPTPPEVFNFRVQVKEDLMALGRLGEVTRGETPVGITSGVALQFLAEQEQQIANTEIASMHDFEKKASSKMLKVAAQNYQADDKRTIMLLGQNRQWVKHTFDPKKLASSFDVRMTESTALPDSKAQRTQSIIDLAGSFPNIMPPEQVIDMLDIAQPEKFVSRATAAVRAAEYENEMLLDGKEVPPPEEWEEHIQHWNSHTRVIQDPVFKKLPKEVQSGLKDHILATEMLMEKCAIKNPLFAQQLATLPQFPTFHMIAPQPLIDPLMDPSAMDPNAMPPAPGAPMPPEADPLMNAQPEPAMPANAEQLMPGGF